MLVTQIHKTPELSLQQLESNSHLLLRESHKLKIGGADPHPDLVILGCKLLEFIDRGLTLPEGQQTAEMPP